MVGDSIAVIAQALPCPWHVLRPCVPGVGGGWCVWLRPCVHTLTADTFVVQAYGILKARDSVSSVPSWPLESTQGTASQGVSQDIPFDFQALLLDPLSPGRHFWLLPFLSLFLKLPRSPFSLLLSDSSEESPCYGLNCVPLLNS